MQNKIYFLIKIATIQHSDSNNERAPFSIKNAITFIKYYNNILNKLVLIIILSLWKIAVIFYYAIIALTCTSKK